MSKNHNVIVNIKNTTSHTFSCSKSKFIFGKFAEGYHEWPAQIPPNKEITVGCWEDTGLIDKGKGCMGWVEYISSEPDAISLYFCFSNTSINGIEVVREDPGTALEAMESHTVPIQKEFYLTEQAEKSGFGYFMRVDIESTDGDYNYATYVINEVDTDVKTDGNDRLLDVIQVFNNIEQSKGYKVTYINADFSSAISHFKGVGAYQDKLIFTHSYIGGDHNGVYFIGNKVVRGQDHANIQTHYRTSHSPKWGHPGGVQTCGSYMVMGLQKSDEADGQSEIQICDIRRTQVFREMVSPPGHHTALINRDLGVNGTGMTTDLDGHYIVAASQGKNLTLYRSEHAGIKSENTTFYEIGINPAPSEDFNVTGNDNFPEDGAGLGLVTQTDGTLFLITMHGSMQGPSTMTLYKIVITEGNKPKATWQRVPDCPTKIMKCPNGTDVNFRWGKGLSVTSPTSIKAYATSRDTGISKSFSVMNWEGKT